MLKSTDDKTILTNTNFKAWWDVMLDYMVGTAGLIILLVFSRLATFETGMLICTHPETGKSYGYSESRYINSRCCRESNAWGLIFYPYVMFFTWMIVSTIHLTWLRIPAIVSKMEGFSEVLNGIFAITPLNYRDPSKPFQIAKEFVYDEENSKQLDRLLNRLQYLLTDKPFLRRSYIIKHSLVMLACFISIFCTLFTLIWITKYELSFECRLVHDPPVRRAYPNESNNNIPTPCHLNSGFFILFTIHFDAFVRLVMFALSAKAMHWIFSHNNKSFFWGRRFRRFGKQKNRHLRDIIINEQGDTFLMDKNEEDERIFGEADGYLSGLPSYIDLVFWIELLNRNSHDGNLMYSSVRSAIRNYCKKFQIDPEERRRNMLLLTEKGDLKPKDGKNKDIFRPADKTKILHDSVFYVSYLCYYMCLKIIPNDMSPNHLFDVLTSLKSELGLVGFHNNMRIRDEIVREMQSFPEIYKPLIDKANDHPDYETYLTRVSDHTTYGTYFVLTAAATLFRVRIALIHFSSNELMPEVFHPVRQPVLIASKKGMNDGKVKIDNENCSLPVKFMCFVEPHYFNMLDESSLEVVWPNVLYARSKYAYSKTIREDLKRMTLNYISEVTDIKDFCREILGIERPSPTIFGN